MFIASLMILAASPVASLNGGAQTALPPVEQTVEKTKTVSQGDVSQNKMASTSTPSSQKVADDQTPSDKKTSKKATFLMVLGVISSVFGISILS